MRVAAERVRRPSRRQLDSGFLGKLHDLPSRAVRCFECDEITTLGLRPGSGAGWSELFLKEIDDALKLWRQDFAVPIHERVNTGSRSQEPQVTELIDLVAADRLRSDSLEHPGDVFR